MRTILFRFILGAAVGLLVMHVYQFIQTFTLARAVLRTDPWSWPLIPFHHAWVWPYESVFLLLGLPWFLLPTLRAVKSFAIALLCAEAVAWLCFLAYPTACERPSTENQPWSYVLLHAMDQPNNCIPCLHMVLAVLGTWSLLSDVPFFRRLAGKTFLLVWFALISVSILALRQHTLPDLLAGACLGALGGWVYTKLKRTPPICAN